MGEDAGAILVNEAKFRALYAPDEYLVFRRRGRSDAEDFSASRNDVQGAGLKRSGSLARYASVRIAFSYARVTVGRCAKETSFRIAP